MTLTGILSYLTVINLTGFAVFGIDNTKLSIIDGGSGNPHCLPSLSLVEVSVVSSVCMYFITKPCILLSGSGFL